ncbi:unnamed protein product, partial [Chrysoparadoxa australica]
GGDGVEGSSSVRYLARYSSGDASQRPSFKPKRYGRKGGTTHPSMGQHLLTNEGILKFIVRSARLEHGDTVLEIGPGTGNLTAAILGETSGLGGYQCMELDRGMVLRLRDRLGELGYVNIAQVGEESEAACSYRYEKNSGLHSNQRIDLHRCDALSV